jgi:cell wall-associated NlpC family hydrolase
MRYFGWFYLILFLSSMSLFSQEKFKKHTVAKGETISEIAQKYNVKPEMIYELNPDAVNGIKGKMVLLIPTNTKQNPAVAAPAITSNLPEKTHEVLPKETLYGIAKQHHIAIDDLYRINPNLEKEGLKIGQTIKIPQTALEDFVVAKEVEKPTDVEKTTVSQKNSPKEETIIALKNDEKLEIPTQGIGYEVLPKETLYSISRKYGIKLADLQNANPALGTTSLKVGQKITVPVKEGTNLSLTTEKVVEQKEVKPEKEVAVQAKPIEEQKESTTQFIHEVLPKQSLYSIAKQYKITLVDLQKANPDLGAKSLKVGQKINVPVKADVNSSYVTDNKEVKIEKEIAVMSQNSDDKQAETEIAHEVLPKETKYGIAKQYGLTVAELENQNPNISKKLLVGSVLKIRSSKLVQKEIAAENAIVTEAPNVEQKIENKETNTVHDADFIDQLISKASENIGTRYRSGGTTTEGFDCSGFMYYTFSNCDIKLPRSSVEMASYGSKIDVQNAQKGDLIFFKTRGSNQINHVGMVVEVLEDEIKFIHSATHGGVIISSTKESYYERNLVQVNRVL